MGWYKEIQRQEKITKHACEATHLGSDRSQRPGTGCIHLRRQVPVRRVHLDGNQRDRLHASTALIAAFPGLGRASVTTLVHSKKIAVIDFAFYVLQGNEVRGGHVAVPVNQQTNDVRAKNIVLMPGVDRKAYRSTDVMPRDGMTIDAAFRFLPRSVTLINAPQEGQYQYKPERAWCQRKWPLGKDHDLSNAYLSEANQGRNGMTNLNNRMFEPIGPATGTRNTRSVACSLCGAARVTVRDRCMPPTWCCTCASARPFRGPAGGPFDLDDRPA